MQYIAEPTTSNVQIPLVAPLQLDNKFEELQNSVEESLDEMN